MGFYKLDNGELLHAPNFVHTPNLSVHKDTPAHRNGSHDGWKWFDTEEEALLYANATQYGLASTVWTENLTRAHRIANNIHAGIVWINCWLLRDLRTPFGGVKSSGVGREGGFEALHFFTEPKNVCIKLK